MANYSKLLSLISGADRTIDFSLASNTLELGGGIQMDGSTSGHVVISASATTSTYSIIWPSAQAASSGYVLTNDGTGQLSWSAPAATGVTSVGLVDGDSTSIFSISNSPITSSGNISISLHNQNANLVLAGPASGSAAQPAYRSLVADDIPSLSSIYLPLAGGTMSGNINMGNNSISNASALSAYEVIVANGGLQLNGSTSGTVSHFANATTTSYSLYWPAAQASSSGLVLSNDGSGNLSWVSASAGSVTSVALALPVSVFTVSGSPVTSSGTLTGSLNTQAANSVWAGPSSGSAATPTFRGLVSADIPNNAANTSGTAANITASSNATLNTLSALTTASSLASVGTITSGTWNASVIGYAYGGTNASSQAAAQANMSPMTTAGDLTYENSTPAPARLAIGSAGQVLTVVSGLPAWANPATSGTVTSVAFADASTAPIYSISGSPVTSSGTLTQTLVTQSANTVFAGPASGSAVQPGFRSLVAADIPSLSSIYIPQSEAGTANGVATLDSTGHIPLSQLPASLVEYKGTWDASSNTPTLANGTGTSGWFYIVSAAGTVNFGAGNITFNVGDWVLYNGSIWERAVQSNVVQSVNGQTGVVTVNAINQLTGDVTAGPASGSASAASTIAKIQGTTVSGTTGSGNVVFSASPTLTGTITAAAANFSGAISASNFSGSSSGTNTGDQTITLSGAVSGSGTGAITTTLGSAVVGASNIATGAFDQVTIVGGAGSAASVARAPALITAEVSGQALSATTLVALRYAMASDAGSTAGQMWKADYATGSNDNFYVVGLAYPGSAVSVGGAVNVTEMGIINVPSHGFTTGAPVYLAASGALTSTAPSTAGQAVVRVGMAKDANNIFVQIQVMGVN